MRHLLRRGVEIRVVEVDPGVTDPDDHGDMVADILPVGQRGRVEQGNRGLARGKDCDEPSKVRGHEVHLEPEFRQPQEVTIPLTPGQAKTLVIELLTDRGTPRFRVTVE